MATTDKFGLIGHPISHSLSPALFKAAYNGRYTYDLIEGDEFMKSYQRFLDEYRAINVTAPFKEQAYAIADIQSEECNSIGAANILIKGDDGKITAANSDHNGVIGAIAAGLFPDKKIRQTALIVGCGGAAKAAAYATATSGYETIIINRNLDKAQDFVSRNRAESGIDMYARPLEEFRKWFRGAGVIIYTLPIAVDALSELSEEDILGEDENKVIIEANYKDPAFSPEMINRMQLINPKLNYISGKEWLLHQAVSAYISFTHEDPNIEQMRKVL